MRQLVFDGPGRLRVQDAPRPVPRPGEVRVEVHSVGICGSDIHGYVGANDRRAPGMVMGHEVSGIVESLGDGVGGLAEGTPVAVNPAVTCGKCEFCRGSNQDQLCPERRLYGCVLELPGAFADSIVVRVENVVPLEGPAPLEWGALVEPFAVGDHGAELVGPPPPHGVLVVGGGPIGLGAALAARRRGAEPVVVSEPLAHRRAVAEALGLSTSDPTRDDRLEGFGAAIECVAAPVTLRSAIEAVRPGGSVVVVGLGEPVIPLPIVPVVARERVVRGAFNYTRASFAAVARWVMSGEEDLSPVLESRVSLDELPGAFEGYANGSRRDVKTLYRGPACEVPAGAT